MHNDIIGLRVSTPQGGSYFQPRSKQTRRLLVNTGSASGSYGNVMSAVDDLPPDVVDYHGARPQLAEELPRIRQLIAQTFSVAKQTFSVVRHSPEEDDEPSLSIVIECREEMEDAFRKRRELLSGQWLTLSGYTLGHASLHLGKHRG